MEVDNINFRSHGKANKMPMQVAGPFHEVLMNGGLEIVTTTHYCHCSCLPTALNG